MRFVNDLPLNANNMNEIEDEKDHNNATMISISIFISFFPFFVCFGFIVLATLMSYSNNLFVVTYRKFNWNRKNGIWSYRNVKKGQWYAALFLNWIIYVNVICSILFYTILLICNICSFETYAYNSLNNIYYWIVLYMWCYDLWLLISVLIMFTLSIHQRFICIWVSDSMNWITFWAA